MDDFTDPGDLGFYELEDDGPSELDDLENEFYIPAPGEDEE